jgi:hypothetical protein
MNVSTARASRSWANSAGVRERGSIADGMTPEARLVLLSAGASTASPLAAELVSAPLHWRSVLVHANNQGATARLHDTLRGLPAATIPEVVSTALRRATLVSAFHQGVLEDRLDEALRTLSAAGIPCVLLKGAALAISTYRSFEGRPMNDVDLLVRADDAERAQRALLDAGWLRPEDRGEDVPDEELYRLHQHLPPLVDGSGTGVGLEIHTDLFSAGHPFGVLTDEIWTGADEVEFRGRPVRVPRPAQLTVHCCLHFAWSHMARSGAWRAFRDLTVLARDPGFDWDEVVTLALRSRARSACYWTLLLARDVSGLPVPDRTLAALEPPLGEATRRVVGRHLANGLLPTARLCPSVRLSRWMWLAAIRPGWSDHGASRPWTHSAEFAPRDRDEVAERGLAKLSHHFRQASRWRTYLSGVLAAGQPS